MTSRTRRGRWNALLVSLAVIGIGFGTWRVHQSRVDAALSETILMHNLHVMGIVANVRSLHAQGDQERFQDLIDFYLDSALDSADALTRDGTRLRAPSLLDGLRRAERARPGDPVVAEKIRRISSRIATPSSGR